MRQLFWAVLGCLAFAQAQAASFDCAKARTPTEKTICGDAELSRLDEDLNKAYRQAQRRADIRNDVRAAQRQWLKIVLGACRDAACMKQAYQRRIEELGLVASTPAPEATPAQSAAEATAQIAPQIPRLHLKAKPPVCKAVAEAVSRGTVSQLETEFPEGGLLIDINGDGKNERVTQELVIAHAGHTSIHMATETGTPIELDPAGEDDEQLIAFGGKFYIYSFSHDQEPDDIPLYLAIIGKDNKEKIVCEFGEVNPTVTISASRNDSLCRLGREKKLNYVPFDTPYGALEQDTSRLTVESGGAASIDIDNDGALERVVQVADYSSNAWPVCVLQGLGVLNQAGDGLDDSFTELLVDQNCPNPAGARRPFLFRGQTYIEILDPNGYPYNIVQLKGKALDTICEFHSQRVFHVLEH